MPRAYIKDDDSWVFTKDSEKILDADPEDLIFIDDMEPEDVASEFNARFPCEHPALSRVLAQNRCVYSPENADSFPTTICISEVPYYPCSGDSRLNEKDIDTIVEVAKALSRVRLDRRFAYFHSDMEKLRQNGCFVKSGEILYAPDKLKAEEKWIEKSAVRDRKRRETGIVFPDDTSNYLSWVTGNCARHLSRYKISINYGQSHRDRIVFAAQACRLFDHMFGADAHRKLYHWNRAIDDWKKNRIFARRWFKKKGYDKDKELMATLRWLDQECKLKPLKRKESFKPSIPKLFRGQK